MGAHKEHAHIAVTHRHRKDARERAEALVKLVNAIDRQLSYSFHPPVDGDVWDAREEAVALLADTKYIDDIEYP